jgi:uncharacterized membrane protein YgdD (TMEM256/DUF423 family)
MATRLLAVAAVWGAVGVALGAFGAHALDGMLRPERLATFETAVRYQLIHALAAGLAASLGARVPGAALAGSLLLGGSAVFSGSLYALVALDVGAFGAIAPVGGVAMIAGWLTLAWGAWRTRPGDA